MKIVFDNGGQTCNNLWSYVQVLIKCIEKHEKAYVLCHDLQIDKFPNLLNNPYLKFPLYTKLLRNMGVDKYLIRIIRSTLNNRFYNIIPHIVKKIKFFSCPWYTSLDDDIPEKYHEVIKRYFMPAENICSDVDCIFDREYTNNVIIGVHIRRGDYSTWHGGRYYYSLEQYANCCKLLMNLFSDKNKKCIFFLSSNEKLELDSSWKDIPFFKLSSSSPISDLYALSKCSYIIGPPSTFSSWASFFGKVPLAFIYDPNCFTPLFRVIASHAKYDSGENIVYHPYLLTC